VNLFARRSRSKGAVMRFLAVPVAVAMVLAVTASSSGASNSGAGSASILGPTHRATGSPVLIGYMSEGNTLSVNALPEIPAAQAAASYVNNHLGGIGGHVLRLDTCTDGGTPSGATDCVNQMIAAHVVAVVYQATTQGQTVITALQAANIPLFAFGAIDSGTLLSKDAFVITNGLGALAGPPALLKQSGGKRGAVLEVDVPSAIGAVQQLGSVFYKAAGATLDPVPIPPGAADFTAQIQAELNKNPDQIALIGSDTFCISAVNALRTLGYSKPIVIDASCISPTIKKALGSKLKGVVLLTITSTDPAAHEVALYKAVMAAYRGGTTSVLQAQGGYSIVLSFARAMSGISGAITPATVAQAALTMKPEAIPLTKGLTFQCNQRQVSFAPSICSTGYLQTTLNSSGNATTFKPIDLSGIIKP
jgi:branched-chain amino acid transport system substrate-binding protein